MWCQSSLARGNAARCGVRAARRLSRNHHHVTRQNVNMGRPAVQEAFLNMHSLSLHRSSIMGHRGSVGLDPAVGGSKQTSLSPLHFISRPSGRAHRRRGNQAAIARMRADRGSRCLGGLSSCLHTLSNTATPSRRPSFSDQRPVVPFGDHKAAMSEDKVINNAVGGIGQMRQFSSTGDRPPTKAEKFIAAVIAGAVVLVVVGVAVLFGAVFIVLLPFIALGLYLLRRGRLRNPGGGFGGPVSRFGGGGRGAGGTDAAAGSGGFSPGMWGDNRPAGGIFSNVIGSMMRSAGARGISDVLAMLPEITSEVTRRALRNPTLSQVLGGGIDVTPEVEMLSGGTKQVEMRLVIIGTSGNKGEAIVKGGRGEDEGGEFIIYEEVKVKMDNGLEFDLSDDDEDESVPRGQKKKEKEKTTGWFSGFGGGSSDSSESGSATADDGRPIEAEFKDK